jgi:Peptidase A4 family
LPSPPAAASAQPPAGKITVPGRPAAARAARPAAATLSDQDLSGDYTGYGASGGSYTEVGATWVEPAVQCTDDSSYITISVSINDITSSFSYTAAEDLGTTASCATGTPVCSDYHATEQGGTDYAYGDTVEPGDNLFASISYAGSGEYTYDLRDVTQGWTQDHTYDNPGAPAGNAQIGLTEAPGYYEAPVEFGAVGFSDATINGTGISPGGSVPNSRIPSSRRAAMTIST